MTARELVDVLSRVEHPELSALTPEQVRLIEEYASEHAPEGFGETDLTMLHVCNRTGHSFEGRLRHPPGWGLRLFGRCDRCGIAIITDGS